MNVSHLDTPQNAVATKIVAQNTVVQKNTVGQNNTVKNNTVPTHIAIVMDGNNRYAKRHGLKAGFGHSKGKDALDPIVRFCLDKGVQVLTVFAFSSENWARPQAEIEFLMTLLENTIYEQMVRMHEYGIRLRFIGDRQNLGNKLQTLMADAEAKTSHFQAMTLVIAIGYGGRLDMVQAAKHIAQKVAMGMLDPNDIDSDTVASVLALADLPEVDMLIRTGGEWRLSNFLLWQAAYAELFFTDTLWPDFDPKELEQMMAEFAKRERRFGKTSEQLKLSSKTNNSQPNNNPPTSPNNDKDSGQINSGKINSGQINSGEINNQAYHHADNHTNKPTLK